MSAIDIASLVRQLPSQYPFVLVDRVLEHDGATGLVATKNVTGSEDFFGGHFPGQPVMPGVLLMEGLAQAAGVWLLRGAANPREVEIQVVGIDGAKFRRPVVPGDQLRLEVRLLRRRRSLARFRGEVRVGETTVAEADLLLQIGRLPPPQVDPSARVDSRAVLEPGVRVGPYCVVGPDVSLGRGTVLDAHVVVEGPTRVGDRNRFYPFSSVGLAPQDLKYRGEPSRLEVGDANTFREFVTVNRGTAGGGSVTRIGSHNLFMTEVHVAHDCQVGDHTIFANAATLAGHVEVQDWATIGAFTGVHQFCRVGAHSFVGGYSVITKDVLPYSRTVGNRPARVYGINSVGLLRRGFPKESLIALKEAFRILLQSRLHTSEALARLQAEGPQTAEALAIVDFVRSSPRGVILKRRRRHVGVEET
jgi:UDP-N-acetylglucosamine acyltransferase